MASTDFFLKEGSEDLDKEAKMKEDVELYPHQKRVVDRLRDKGSNVIIAHSVGSGKTLTAIAGFEHLKDQGNAHRALVVAPASLRENFSESGVHKFTDSSVNIIGNKQEIRSKPDIYGLPTKDKDYNVVSYELFRMDPHKYIKETGADTVIFDELHRGKNITKTYKAIRDSRSDYDNFIGATGSIVSNKLTDVLPLIDAATAGKDKLANAEHLKEFDRRYFQRADDKISRKKSYDRRPIIGIKNKRELQEYLGSYVDYAGYEDIKDIADMPGKRVHDIFVPLSKEQAHAYRDIVHDNKKIREAIKNRRYQYLKNDELSSLYNQLTEARKLMNDVSTVNPNIPEDKAVEMTPKLHRMLEDIENYEKTNPKGKVVATSFLVHGGTEAIEQGLNNRNINYGRFLGKGQEGVTEESRQEAVKQYNKNRLRHLVLSSAGGEGLSLDETNKIYMLDLHFNPEKNHQMEARGIRSGGLKSLPPEERYVDINRYIATMPPKKFLFFKYKDPLKTPDEIIYELSERKDKQNELLRKTMREWEKKKEA